MGPRPAFVPPPLDELLFFPEVFEHHRRHNPDYPLFVYQDHGIIQTITWSRAVFAIDTAARYIRNFCPDGDRSTIIALLANTDTFTYFILVSGIFRAGYQVFPISPRNSAAGVASLLLNPATKPTALLVSHNPGIQRLVAATFATPLFRAACHPNVLPIPTFEYLFSNSGDEGNGDAGFQDLPYPMRPRGEDPCLILHTSGTTAFPKPVVITARHLHDFSVAYRHERFAGLTFACHAISMYHATGFFMIPWTVCTGVTLASFSPDTAPVIPGSDAVITEAILTGSQWIFCVPSYIEAWARDPKLLQSLKTFQAVMYSGGPLQKETGDVLASEGVNLLSCYAATEIGLVVELELGAKEDWEYFKFSDSCNPVLLPYDQDIYRLIFLESPAHRPHVLNAEYNGAKAYDSLDLVVQHPTKPELWRVHGRADEQLMHSTGEKTNPIPIELTLARHPKIAHAVMFGRGRFHAGVLIQPVEREIFHPGDLHQLANFRNEIWPLMESINDQSPAHSRIFKEMIIVSHPSKPFEMAPKNIPKRTAVLLSYETEIDEAYASVEQSSQNDIQAPEVWEFEECLRFVRTAVERVVNAPLRDEDDMFQAGCDSLQATWIRNTLLRALQHSAKTSTRRIPINFVYSNPTIQRLAIYVMQVIQWGQSSVALMVSSKRLSEMGSLVEHFSADFPTHQASHTTLPNTDIALLVGSTGFLGAHILEQLILDPGVSVIYALNSRDSQGCRGLDERQEAAMRSHDLPLSLLSSKKLVLLEGSIGQEYFGLSFEIYRHLQDKVTCIFHNAWRVDFNISLSSLQPLLAGTRRIIDFALGSRLARPPKVVFVSTLGVFTNWGGSVVPEELSSRPTSAIGIGYAESKWVAEHILYKASQRTSLRPTIVRVGDLCGGRSGAWDTMQWVPILIRSGQVLRCLPCPRGDVFWIPVNVAAAALVEMRTSDELFLNLSHPRSSSAGDMFAAFSRELGVPLVEYKAWLAALASSRHEDSNSAVAAAKKNPALVLFDFYRSMYRALPESPTCIKGSTMGGEAFGFPSTKMDKAFVAAPNALSRLAPISGVEVVSWVRYWRQVGFLDSEPALHGYSS